MTATHVCTPQGDHTHTIIFLHGRDNLASEFASEFFESQASDDRTLQEIFPTIKWIFPSSKIRKSARFEAEMSQWFDIWSVEEPEERAELQLQGLNESIEDILSIIKDEVALIGSEKIILGGISQGCATAIYALLCGRIKLGGFVGLSSWLPFQSKVEAIAKNVGKSEQLQSVRSLVYGEERGMSTVQDLGLSSSTTPLETPILLEHCRDDEVVPVINGQGLYKSLGNLGLTVRWQEYEDGGHWLNEPEGVDNIVDFLASVLKEGQI